MSKRRKTGDWVWLKPNSGFVSESNKYKAEIIGPESDTDFCWCSDPECREWPTLHTEEINGKRHTLCHVGECQMLDEKYE